jgi:hypothetical protein
MMFTEEAIQTESSDKFDVKLSSDMAIVSNWKAGQETMVRRIRRRSSDARHRPSFARRAVLAFLRSFSMYPTTAPQLLVMLSADYFLAHDRISPQPKLTA